MIKVKFCGLSRIEDISTANELRPDYIGFVFWDRSKRYINYEKSLELKRYLDGGIQAVGVFLDEDIEQVAKILSSDIIDIAQLHGHEDEEYIKKLQETCGKPVIKAFNISSEMPNDMARNNALMSRINDINACSADYVLVDGKAAGSGKTFDWSVLSGIERPYFLAGGLNLDNIEDAIKLNPYAVDVSSGIETDGVKDKEKMKKFVQYIRRL